MNSVYQSVIGLEVHVELNTKTKMFCACPADYFGKEPNTHVCPICLGLPGALPYINQEAINKCIQIGLALNCQIAEKSLFERKNYFYPDLPKGYQISQYRWPLCINGWIEVGDKEGKKKIRINRVHQEEDTGKLSHPRGGTLIDFNRSGVPLVEVVTEPDFSDTEQVKDYAKKLQQVFRYLEVSSADMEKGDMRLEANVSVANLSSHISSGKVKLPDYRVEIKNINSFRFIEDAIKYEISRQISVLESGGTLVQETRGWDENKKQTFTQRVKEEANDYRYFPEPDLSDIRCQISDVRKVKEVFPELPWDKEKRFVTEYGIGKEAARILSATKELADFFESVVEHGRKHDVDAKQIANFIVNQKINIEEVLPAQVIEQVLGKKVGVIASEAELEKIIKVSISENPDMVKSYRKGKIGVIQALVGVVMRKTAGKADATKVREILEGLITTS